MTSFAAGISPYAATFAPTSAIAAPLAAPASSNTIDAAAPSVAASPQPSAARGTDALAAMRGDMNAAQAHGGLQSAGDAASVLGTGSSYVRNAEATVAKLDTALERRAERLASMQQSGASSSAIDAERNQLDLLQRLRDRIQLSAERIRDIISGHDRDDITRDPDGTRGPRSRDTRVEQLEAQLDAMRQRVQVTSPVAQHGAAPVSDQVASVYAASRPV